MIFQVTLVWGKGNVYLHFYLVCILMFLENELIQKGAGGFDIGMLKLYLLLYADDIVIFFKY